ncbi:LOW QUALITY PROTEIN: Rho_GDI domain-containing protein, partial [Cephalotus follicularis]
MSLTVGAVPSSSNMGFDDTDGEGHSDTKAECHEGDDEAEERLGRQMSETSLYTDQEEDDEAAASKIQLGPQCTVKEHLEKDKYDESLRKWKKQLLGSVDFDNVGAIINFVKTLDPEVNILSLSFFSPGRPNIFLSIPGNGKPKGLWFTLKEGIHYSLKFSFQVSNNIVSGLKYTNTVWKTGVNVDSSKEMLGTFSPQPEPYTVRMPEETTPSGVFPRGSYSARSKFLEDDNKCYLEID